MPKSQIKSQQARQSPALSAWRRACKSKGYYNPGGPFKALPKKGTSAYKDLYEEYQMELQVGNSHKINMNSFNYNN
jgi:hypothetical protein